MNKVNLDCVRTVIAALHTACITLRDVKVCTSKIDETSIQLSFVMNSLESRGGITDEVEEALVTIVSDLELVCNDLISKNLLFQFGGFFDGRQSEAAVRCENIRAAAIWVCTAENHLRQCFNLPLPA